MTMGIFSIKETDIPGVIVIDSKAFHDSRGFFTETYNKGNLLDLGFKEIFVQDNLSKSSKGVLRGLHYQINPTPMGKLVRCIKGKIFDVGVDVRKGSKTFGKWYGQILDDKKTEMIYFPPGIAHGFLSLTDDTLVYYKCTGLYAKDDERAMIWNDPAVGIKWPLDQIDGEPNLSDKDKINPTLKLAEIF